MYTPVLPPPHTVRMAWPWGSGFSQHQPSGEQTLPRILHLLSGGPWSGWVTGRSGPRSGSGRSGLGPRSGGGRSGRGRSGAGPSIAASGPPSGALLPRVSANRLHPWPPAEKVCSPRPSSRPPAPRARTSALTENPSAPAGPTVKPRLVTPSCSSPLLRRRCCTRRFAAVRSTSSSRTRLPSSCPSEMVMENAGAACWQASSWLQPASNSSNTPAAAGAPVCGVHIVVARAPASWPPVTPPVAGPPESRTRQNWRRESVSGLLRGCQRAGGLWPCAPCSSAQPRST